MRKQAEDALKVLSQQPSIVPELMHRVQYAEDPQMRQLAAVLLRKRISKHWEELPEQVGTRLFEVMFDCISFSALECI